jgi:excisionase family DNA binding protein
MDFFFTTGQVAKELKCSDQTIRNLCASGQITASRSAGGHYRIAPAELERLRALEELPAVARAMISNGARQLKKNTHELLGPPSEQVIQTAEDAFISDRELATDTNRLERLKIRKQAVELTDFFEDRNQHRLEKELVEQRRKQELAEKRKQQQEAALAAEERQRFTSKWVAYAVVQRPSDAPIDYPLVIQDDVLSTLNKLDPATNESVVQALIDAAIAHSLRPSRLAEERSEAKRIAVNSALDHLPIYMRWDDDWVARAHKAASDAIESAREDASTSHFVATAKLAVRPLIIQYRHQERIQKAMKYVALAGGDYEDQQGGQEAIRVALADLPVDITDRQIEQAKANALAPIQERITTRGNGIAPNKTSER